MQPRSRRDYKPCGHPIRGIEGQLDRFEAYFRTLPTSCIRTSVLSRPETVDVNKWMETDREGFLLNNLDEVLSFLSQCKRSRDKEQGEGDVEEDEEEKEEVTTATVTADKRARQEVDDVFANIDSTTTTMNVEAEIATTVPSDKRARQDDVNTTHFALNPPPQVATALNPPVPGETLCCCGCNRLINPMANWHKCAKTKKHVHTSFLCFHDAEAEVDVICKGCFEKEKARPQAPLLLNPSKFKTGVLNFPVRTTTTTTTIIYEAAADALRLAAEKEAREELKLKAAAAADALRLEKKSNEEDKWSAKHRQTTLNSELASEMSKKAVAGVVLLAAADQNDNGDDDDETVETQKAIAASDFLKSLAPPPHLKKIQDQGENRGSMYLVKGMNSAIWTALPKGFNKFTNKSFQQIVICNTCLAEIDLGKDLSPNSIVAHLRHHHNDEYNIYIIEKSEVKPAAEIVPVTNIKTFFKVDEAKKNEDVLSKKISQTKKFASAFVANDWTFALVENQEFRDYQLELSPKALLFTSVRMHDTIVISNNNKFKGLAVFMEESMGKHPFVSITNDSWTGPNKETYSGLTVHAMDKSWTLYSFPGIVYKINGHTHGADISKNLDKLLKNYNVRVLVGVTDCEAAMVAAWRAREHCMQGCFDHRIEIAAGVFDQLPGNKAICDKAKQVASFYHSSSQAAAKLKEVSKLMLSLEHPLGLTTVLDIVTRWWSKYSCYSRLLLLRSSLSSLVEIEGGRFYPPDLRLKADEWEVLSMGVEVLEPLMVAQRYLEGEIFVTNTHVAPIVHMMRIYLDQALLAQRAKFVAGTPNIFKTLEALIDAFSERFGFGFSLIPARSIVEYPFYIIETPYGSARERIGGGRQPQGFTILQVLSPFFDLRFKDLFWLPETEHQLFHFILIDFIIELHLNDDLPLPTRYNDSDVAVPYVRKLVVPKRKNPVTPAPTTTGDLTAFRRGLGVPRVLVTFTELPEDERSRVAAEVKRELASYNTVPSVDTMVFDNVGWWKENCKSYPLMSKLARILFGTPATSAPTERTFSVAGNIARSKRSNLTSDCVEMLVLAKTLHQFEKRFNINLDDYYNN